MSRLAEAGQNFWQVLSIGPTGFGDSPYQSLSSFAGNPLLISLSDLAKRGWLTDAELQDCPHFPSVTVDFGSVAQWRNAMLTLAYKRFIADNGLDNPNFRKFEQNNSDWLYDFALYKVLKEAYGQGPWFDWPKAFAFRNEEQLKKFRNRRQVDLYEQVFRRWQFAEQWRQVKTLANAFGIYLIGDVPIYVAHDSCDVWVHHQAGLFDLDENGKLLSVAGAPADYYSSTGQRWGNPLYWWDRHRETGYRWWKQRLSTSLRLFDLVRIDHFRGLYNYWKIPGDEPIASKGQWHVGPRDDFLKALGRQITSRLIAEDLGDEMTPVRKWKNKW